ncbi:hypothetical protein GS429_19735 [Natronorubrum sp. JWXQ-INN-674]|uniref:Uncharacterized protein n=1 Tax=Natronorubrum halalkaliphilum TaxID=2691917 RepID=A0A6B0VSA2_9EURY|nr:hypothetical protein [Natronorubrum halalkaliphilum]MXV64255.1 hypothetical protein [Natronorubrum halalkaliphilum]
MIGALTVGKKAVTFGYKRYGIPGAVASGGIALAGYVAVRRALQSATNADDDALDSAIDADSITNAVEQEGLQAVTDVQTLDEAIDQDELRSGVDVDDIQSSVSDETDEFTGDHEQGAE